MCAFIKVKPGDHRRIDRDRAHELALSTSQMIIDAARPRNISIVSAKMFPRPVLLPAFSGNLTGSPAFLKMAELQKME